MFLKMKGYCFLIGFHCLILQPIVGQDQQIADSLSRIYQEGSFHDSAKLELLRNLSFNEVNNLQLSLRYAEELITLAKQTGDHLYLHRGYYQKGNKKRLLGDLTEALEAYFLSAEAAQLADYIKGEASSFGAIADIYSISNNHTNARLYYEKAIATLRQTDDTVALASFILNAGDEFFNNASYDTALWYFQESELLFDQADYPIGKAYSLGNLGMVYARTGAHRLAEENINAGISILEELQDYYPISVYLISMAEIYLERSDRETAMGYLKRSLGIAQQYGLKEQVSEANLKLSELSGELGHVSEAYQYYQDHIRYRDSVNNIKAVQAMADLRTNYEVSQKQIEVDLLSQQKRSQRIVIIATILTSALIFLLALGLYRRNQFIKATNRIIEEEKNRSENLLLNILPRETAEELKQNGKVQAKKFDSVTVLFSDFKGFTKQAEQAKPEHLIRSLDFYFREFDRITSKYGLEKIKTIGDAYMCAGGLPIPDDLHAKQVVKAAREMLELVNGVLPANDDLIHFEVRIGIHTGPVVAGIVGMKKWQYDIWGDTVNIASRMESLSEAGRINLSESTYREINDEFSCEYRGEIAVKNHEALKMYFLA